MKKKLFLLISAMVLIAFAGSLMINIIKYDSDTSSDTAENKLNIVTTFYPIYLIGLNIADQIDLLDVKSLTQLNTGCLHDYQLTTEDMKLISNADILIINGGGMESFLEDVRTNYPELTIIDTTKDITLLSNETEHADEEESGEENEVIEEDTSDSELVLSSEPSYETNDAEEEEHDHEHGENNAHVWLDPKLYIKQIETVRDELVQYINDNEIEKGIDHTALIRQLEENSDKYISSVEGLNEEMERLLKSSPSGDSGANAESNAGPNAEANIRPKAVVFHDSFAYLAEKVGIEIAHTIELDSDTALSAGEIAEIIDEVNQENIRYLFTEQQYSDSIAKQIAEETNAEVYIIDSVVTGNAKMDSYLTAMRFNLNTVKTAINENIEK